MKIVETVSFAIRIWLAASNALILTLVLTA